jgi:outer membrane protein OmpA-like peptidoglycan-associated protein
MPEFIDFMPENFTLEFDLACDYLVGSWGLHTIFAESADRNNLELCQSANNRISFHILPGGDGNGMTQIESVKAGTAGSANTSPTTQFADVSKPVHVAFWRQKERMRLYLNEEKVWDVPKAILPDVKFNSLVFWVQLIDNNHHFLISNLRLATGAPDTRNKILKENKWVTHGILFDVNSATIKPESSGSLREIASVLKENPELKVKIVGHTDSDGKDEDNLDLSKRRAAAVKEALARDFSIDVARMQTDGKGESEPIDKNDTPAGKANNRRVEFIKM